MRRFSDKIYFNNENEYQKAIRNSYIYNTSQEDKVSNTSSAVTTNDTKSDSGLSSLNSAQLFFAEIRDHLTNRKNIKTNKNKSYAKNSIISKSVINTLSIDQTEQNGNLIFNLGNVLSNKWYLNR